MSKTEIVDIQHETVIDTTEHKTEVTSATLIVVEEGGSGGDAATLQGKDSAYHLDRLNHTGEQPQSTVTGLVSALSALEQADAQEAQTRQIADANLQSQITDVQTLAQTNQLNLGTKADQVDLDATNAQVETNRLAILTKADITALATLTALVNTKADEAYVNAQIAALVGSSPEALNTIYELAAAIESESSVIDALEASVANRVRFDIATQALTLIQQQNARTNIGAEAAGTAAALVAAITPAAIGAATAAQGAKADTALQSGDVAPVALSGLFSSLAGQSGIFDVVFGAYTAGTNAAINAADSLGVMLRKLQAQVTALSGGIQAAEYTTPTVLKNFTNQLISTPPLMSECLLDANFSIPANTLAEGDVYMLHAFLVSKTVSQATVSFLVVPYINDANINGSSVTVPIPANGNIVYEVKCYITIGSIGTSGSISVQGLVFKQDSNLLAFASQTATYNTTQNMTLNFAARVNAALNANSWLKLRSAKLYKLRST